MDTRPIGVFDSGLGGLTAVRQLKEIMPLEHIIYFGDTARVPYGNRSRETLLKYARQDMRFLKSFDPKAVVIACGTISTNCLEVLREEFDIPIIGVVEPTVNRAVSLTKNKKVGMIATRSSVGSGAYQKAFAQLDPSVTVTSKACPLFVPLVEEGRTSPEDVVIRTVAEEYLAELIAQDVDTLVLGCTHYPLLSEVVGSIMGERVSLVDAGCESAYAVKKALKEMNALSVTGHGHTDFYVSDRPEDFDRLASIFLHETMVQKAKQIDIETY